MYHYFFVSYLAAKIEINRIKKNNHLTLGFIFDKHNVQITFLSVSVSFDIDWRMSAASDCQRKSCG